MFTSLRRNLALAIVGGILAFTPMVAMPAVVSASGAGDEAGGEAGGSITTGAGADIGGGLTCGADFTLSLDGGCESTDTGADRIQEIIELIVNIFSILVGLIAVFMIIYGGFKYITSRGDSGELTAARNTIIYAVIGLVIVALAQFLVQFVLNQVLE